MIEGLRPLAASAAQEALYTRVYRELRAALMAGAVQPGDTLNIRPLAVAMGTSSMPVREALARLVAEGALESLANRAFRVPVMTPERYRELLQIRLRLEGLAAERAALLIEPAELGRLKRLHALISAERERSMRDYLARNQEFHFIVYAAARMPALMGLIETLWLRIGPLLHAYGSPADLGAAMRRHAAILTALEAGDAPAAGAAIQQDLLQASGAVFDYLEQHRHGAAKTVEPLPEPAVAAS